MKGNSMGELIRWQWRYHPGLEEFMRDYKARLDTPQMIHELIPDAKVPEGQFIGQKLPPAPEGEQEQ